MTTKFAIQIFVVSLWIYSIITLIRQVQKKNIRRKLIEKLTPDYFQKGKSFDKDVFDSLVTALMARARNKSRGLATYYTLNSASILVFILIVLNVNIRWPRVELIALCTIVIAIFYIIICFLPAMKNWRQILMACKALGITELEVNAALDTLEEAKSKPTESASNKCQRCGKTVLKRSEFTSELSKMGLKLDAGGNITLSGAFNGYDAMQNLQQQVAKMEGDKAIQCKSCGKVYCVNCLTNYAPQHRTSGGKACFSCEGSLQEI